jgi:hypothetical protein
MSPSKIVRILDPKCRSNVCETVKSVSGAVKMAQEGKKSLTAGTSDCLSSHVGNGAVSADQQSFDVVKGGSDCLGRYDGKIMARFRA